MDDTPIATDSAETLRQAGALLRDGRLVAFPTETVYGLGANALDAGAVARIFDAKGRPANNPVIVHIADPADWRRVAATWPDPAQQLADRFWPGPLTLVLPRSSALPDIVTAGGPTVAIRMPAHPTALALIRAAGVPVAAPSANRSGEISPTNAAHVLASLNGRIDLIIDGGPTRIGLESTVLDLTASPPRLLRPGHITPAQIEAIIGPIQRQQVEPGPGPLPSPGMLAKHYAPHTPTICVPTIEIAKVARLGGRTGFLVFAAREQDGAVIVMRCDPIDYAARLYAELHRLDGLGLDRIVIEEPPADEEWLAVRDRIRRASERLR